jgi:tetratricopeptide (TPR) repeat protein
MKTLEMLKELKRGTPAALIGALLYVTAAMPLPAEEAPPAPISDSPRVLYNDGTRQLRAGKLTEAEELLQTSVAAQDIALQPMALYNLGCVRVAQGVELLKKSKDPGGRANKGHVEALTGLADDASQAIDAAIASENEQQMILAYLRGHGVHREINTATKAVRKALEAKQDILAKWQRAAGDFRGAAELKNTDADATFNAAATERSIAALIDKLDQLQQAGMKMQAAGQQLGQKLQKLKGMIPAANMPPGAPGDDEDDDDLPGMTKGEQEGAGKTGEEMKISPEEVEQMLAGYKLGGDHRLPLGQEGTAKPKDHTGKDW